MAGAVCTLANKRGTIRFVEMTAVFAPELSGLGCRTVDPALANHELTIRCCVAASSHAMGRAYVGFRSNPSLPHFKMPRPPRTIESKDSGIRTRGAQPLLIRGPGAA